MYLAKNSLFIYNNIPTELLSVAIYFNDPYISDNSIFSITFWSVFDFT